MCYIFPTLPQQVTLVSQFVIGSIYLKIDFNIAINVTVAMKYHFLMVSGTKGLLVDAQVS